MRPTESTARRGLRSTSSLELIQLLLDALEGLLHPIIGVLGFRAASMDQHGGGHDEREELEELRLPVLEGWTGRIPR